MCCTNKYIAIDCIQKNEPFNFIATVFERELLTMKGGVLLTMKGGVILL